MPNSLVHLLLIPFRVAEGQIVDNFDAFWRANKFIFFRLDSKKFLEYQVT